MKPGKFLSICLLISMCCGSSCKENGKYPITVELGEYACIGTISLLPIPHTDLTNPPLPGLLLGLETNSGNYVLSYNGQWILNDELIVEDVVYSVDDEVEIMGMVIKTQISSSEEYTELKIGTIIKKSI